MKLSLHGFVMAAGLFFSSAIANAQSAAVHGMVLFGGEQLYVSHIPLYMTPHDYQALAKVTISSTGLAAYNKYNVSGQQYFTLAPKPFVLPQLLSGALTTFKADLYRGSFEQGGRVIASNVTVTVQKVEYQTRLSKAAVPASSLTYLTLNDGENSYLAHKITAPNNFDHIVQIKWLNKGTSETPSNLPAETVPSNVEVVNNGSIKVTNNTNLLQALPVEDTFAKAFQVSDKIASRLQEGQLFTINADGSIEEAASEESASFQVVSDFYCTQGPDFYNPCN